MDISWQLQYFLPFLRRGFDEVITVFGKEVSGTTSGPTKTDLEVWLSSVLLSSVATDA